MSEKFRKLSVTKVKFRQELKASYPQSISSEKLILAVDSNEYMNAQLNNHKMRFCSIET